jgi:hypothetical protein
MRSAGSTYLVLDLSVASLTKEKTISFAGPLFHDGNGSLWAWPVAIARLPRRKRAAAPVETNARRLKFVNEFFVESFMQPPIFLHEPVLGSPEPYSRLCLFCHFIESRTWSKVSSVLVRRMRPLEGYSISSVA